MPKIKAFQGIRPNPEYVDQVVLPLENLSIDQAKEIRQDNPISYVNMLVPKLENRFMLGSKKELAFKQINENFEDFLDKGIYLCDEKPSLYVYRIAHKGMVQTGIWTVTSIDDYLNNTVKKHELTRHDREIGLIDYLQQTGIDANPVLITYQADPTINAIIADAAAKPHDLHFTLLEQEHWLWKISDAEKVDSLIRCFGELPASYIADGHHRAAAACTAGIERRKRNLKHRGDEEYNFFNSVYMASDQLKIYEFHRLIKDLGSYSEADFLTAIGRHFDCLPASGKVVPTECHQFGMYINGHWYLLKARPETFRAENPAEVLDVSILQNFILSPILHIHDARTDSRICFSGGVIPVEQLEEQVDNGEFIVAFTLYPTSIKELIQVADAGEVMPPKSTWFEPKFLAGLVIHLIT
ncbi:MAG TPA: DUF1015 family protein [Sphingobacteriaceae bacterium]